jgi:hypothetical protein
VADDEEVTMRPLGRSISLGAIGLMLLAFSGPVMASGSPSGAGRQWLPEAQIPAFGRLAAERAAWQRVVTGQIAAFAAGDAEKAFGYASAVFHDDYPDAKSFFLATLTHGYLPILTSRSHSFGPFKRVGVGMIAQMVTFVEANQDRYEALYLMAKEGQGWRVRGVVLTRSQAMTI